MLVAITRAQALLIVIGDPEVAVKDELWRTFLNYVKSRNGWKGKMHNWKTEDVYLPGYEIVPREGSVMYGKSSSVGRVKRSAGLRRVAEGEGMAMTGRTTVCRRYTVMI
jgi:hypothetical protein